MGLLERRRGENEPSGSRKVHPGVGQGVGVDIISLSDDCDEGSEPQIVTVSLGAVLTTKPPATSNALLRALIQWGGAKSAAAPLLLDLQQGRRVTLEASHTLRVTVIYGAPADVGPEVNVSVTAIYGTLGGAGGNSLTHAPFGLLAGAAQAQRTAVPAWATTLAVSTTAPHMKYDGSIAGQVLLVELFRAVDSAAADTAFTMPDEPFWLPQGITHYRVTNMAAAPAVFTPVFGLAM